MINTRRQNTPAISSSWRNGRYWDHWMIVHFFSGVAIGLVFPFIKAPATTLYLIAFAVLVGWELVEYFFDIHELLENRVLDILLGLGGIGLAVTYITPALSRPEQIWVFFITVALNAFLCMLGWRAFIRRRKSGEGD